MQQKVVLPVIGDRVESSGSSHACFDLEKLSPGLVIVRHFDAQGIACLADPGCAVELHRNNLNSARLLEFFGRGPIRQIEVEQS